MLMSLVGVNLLGVVVDVLLHGGSGGLVVGGRGQGIGGSGYTEDDGYGDKYLFHDKLLSR